MNYSVLLLKLGVLALAVLTTWWLWFPAVATRFISTFVTEKLWANWSLDFNCFWIASDLSKRKMIAAKRLDSGKVDAIDDLLDQVSEVWEEAKEEDETVPDRSTIAKRIGVRRSL